MLKKLDDFIRKMFVEYASEHPISIDSSNSSTLASYHASQGNANDVDEDEDWDDQFRLKMNKKCGEQQRSELDMYLKDDNEDDGLGFDILAWWKMKASKYHVISFMARDILVILMSIVSFESAFSTKG